MAFVHLVHVIYPRAEQRKQKDMETHIHTHTQKKLQSAFLPQCNYFASAFETTHCCCRGSRGMEFTFLCMLTNPEELWQAAVRKVALWVLKIKMRVRVHSPKINQCPPTCFPFVLGTLQAGKNRINWKFMPQGICRYMHNISTEQLKHNLSTCTEYFDNYFISWRGIVKNCFQGLSEI